MVDEYKFLKAKNCSGGVLPPVSRCYSSLVDEILSQHELFNTPYFKLSSQKREELQYFKLDDNYFIETRPPVYSREGCVQIPLNYNIGLYHKKCIVKDSKFLFNDRLPIVKLRKNLSLLNTLEYANSHGHFVIQIVPQIIHSNRFFSEYVPTVANSKQKWYAEILTFFEIEENKINFFEIPKQAHVEANNSIHIEVPDHTSGFALCHRLSRKKYNNSESSIQKKIFLCRDNNLSRIENYDEVLRCLKKNDFIVADPLKLSLETGRQLLFNADVVVVEFGGSFTNLIHLEQGTKVIVLIPAALLDHKLNAKPKHFVYNLLEWLQPLLFFFDVKIVKGTYNNDSLYRWDSGDKLGDSERTKCEYPVNQIVEFLQ